MCGIVGILGREPVAGQLVDALKRLEYRGYDSAGVAVLEGGRGVGAEERGVGCRAGHGSPGRWEGRGRRRRPGGANAQAKLLGPLGEPAYLETPSCGPGQL